MNVFDNFLKRLIENGCTYREIKEELTHVNYRHHIFLVNREGTIVLKPCIQYQGSRVRYAIYKGQWYYDISILEVKGVLRVGIYYLGRMILMAFGKCIRDEEKPQKWFVSYKDGNKLNCNIDNLEWISKVDFATKTVIKKKGFCIKKIAKENGINRTTLNSRLRKRDRNMEESINFVDKKRNMTIPREYLKTISKETGINIITLVSRYLKGDRGTRLTRTCYGRSYRHYLPVNENGTYG